MPGTADRHHCGVCSCLTSSVPAPRRAAVIADVTDLPVDVAAADLVITGEGCLDWQSLQGKVVAGVAELAAAHATPAVALAGQVLIGRREAMAMGLAGSYAVADKHADLAPVMADPVGTLADRAERVAATWSPRR